MQAVLNLELDADLVENLKRTTEAQGVTIAQVMDELARKYLAAARRQAIDREFEHYQALHASLRDQYMGENVAIYEGKLVDHDANALTLVRRVRAKYGDAPVLVTLVRAKPVQEFVVKSPRLVRAE